MDITARRCGLFDSVGPVVVLRKSPVNLDNDRRAHSAPLLRIRAQGKAAQEIEALYKCVIQVYS